MKKIKFIIIFIAQILFSFSCTGNEKLNREYEINSSSGQYKVYIINSNMHTGIVIPVNAESINKIRAMQNFKSFQFTDIGWGEEKFYQDPEENFCMGARAILWPNTSIIRIEGYRSIDGSFISWSDFTVQLTLSPNQFIKLCEFIDNSFRRSHENNLIITSEKGAGRVIFFKSVLKYHLFNTCNTWVAEALKSADFDISPFLILTAGQLYDEIKDRGTIVKALK